MRSQISGSVRLNTEELIDRKLYRFMGEASAYAYLSMDEAIKDAGLELDEISSEESVGLSAQAADLRKTSLNRRIFSEKGSRTRGAYRIPRTMSSSVSPASPRLSKLKG